ncbi:MAG: CoA transferase, partial [Chloroflexi bacterium]|nr:CoA transferase [Chloroflexota bacterium]
MAHLPLHGVRIADLTGVWAGTFATLLLADLGAEVIKQENPFVWQPNTRGRKVKITPEMLPGGLAWNTGYPHNEPGPRPWNYTPTFVQLYRNKRSFTVDIRKPEGKDILRRLIAVSDVVMENSSPGTMEKLGITYDWLRGIRDDIIYVRMPAFGSSGPYRDARALGVHLESAIGHALLRGYPDTDPSNLSAIFVADYLAGSQTALATMMALWHRWRTGRGQLVEVAQAETAMPALAQAFMDWALNGQLQAPGGNRSLYGAAPCGVYPCRSVGLASECGDRWIALAVADEDQWEALRKLMGDPEWARAPELATAGGRAERQDLLDARMGAWTAQFDDYELMHLLQGAGIAAMPVLEA